MPAVNKQIKQLCQECAGTGVTDKVVKDDSGRTVLRSLYTKGDGDKPLYQNCPECDGEGMTLQPLPNEIVVDGEPQKLSPQEAFSRFNPAVV